MAGQRQQGRLLQRLTLQLHTSHVVPAVTCCFGGVRSGSAPTGELASFASSVTRSLSSSMRDRPFWGTLGMSVIPKTLPQNGHQRNRFLQSCRRSRPNPGATDDGP